MTTTTSERTRTRVWLAAGLLVTLAGSALVVVTLMLADRTEVRSHEEQAQVELGLPLGWVTQDQSAQEPPLWPHRATFESPWEHPTEIQVLPLAADLAAVAAVPLVLVGGLRARLGRGRCRT